MKSARNYLNCVTDSLTQTFMLLPSRSLNYIKLTKLRQSKVTPPTEKTEITFLAVVFYSLSAATWSLKNYTPSNKQAWKSYPFESANQNNYGMKCTTSTFPTPQFSRSTLIQTTSIQKIYFTPKIWDMIPADIKNVNNLSDFTLKIESWIPDGCHCRLFRAYICQVGYINYLISLTDSFSISVLFCSYWKKEHFCLYVDKWNQNMFYCIFVYNGVYSPLICDFVKPTLIY